MSLYDELCQCLDQSNVSKDELMSRHTTFRVGGPADFFVMPTEEEEVRAVVNLLKKENVPYYVIGNGSNLLVGDGGYRGVVIQICKNMNKIRVEDDMVYAQAGALLSKTAAQALEHALTGMEFASGIPGTLGGAVMMNAGAYGGEMKHILYNALDGTGIPEQRFCQKRRHCAERTAETSAGRSGKNPCIYGGIERKACDKTTVGISECGKYVQTSRGIFCGKTDRGYGTAWIPCRRRTGFGETLWICDQPGECDGGGHRFIDGAGGGPCGSEVRRTAGTGSKTDRGVLRDLS